jgi:hypothetical protein
MINVETWDVDGEESTNPNLSGLMWSQVIYFHDRSNRYGQNVQNFH